MTAALARSKRRVKNLFIHKHMQREFSLVLIMLLIVVSFVISFTIHFTIRDAAFGGGALQFGKVNPYQVLSEVSYKIIARVTVVLFIALIFLASYGIQFLHRVAGPMYRIRKTLIYLNQGTVPSNIKLRKGDFFVEVAEEVNKQIYLFGEQKSKIEEAKKLLNENLSQGLPADARSEIEKVKGVLGGS